MIESGDAVDRHARRRDRADQRLEAKQGEFGAFLQLAHNWASFDNTIKSYRPVGRARRTGVQECQREPAGLVRLDDVERDRTSWARR